MAVKECRVLHVAVALLLVVCMVIGCTAGAYAEVITLVAFSAAVVVSAVLTACGLIMTQGNSPDAWENLCKTVAEVAQLPSTLSLALIGGLTYLDAAIINAIVQAANQQQAFEPVAQDGYLTISNYTFPFYQKDDGNMFLSTFIFDNGSIWLPHILCPPGEVTTAKQNGVEFVCDFTGAYPSVIVRLPWTDNYSFEFRHWNGFTGETVVFVFPVCIQRPDGIYLYYGADGAYLKDGRWTNGTAGFAFPHLLSDVFEGTPSISAEFPWELDPDGYAGVDDDGKVALPGAWPDAGVVIDGAPALPLSVPADTIPGAATQDPTAARTGEGTKVDTDNPAIDTDTPADETWQKIRDKFSLAPLTKCFPFSIPWDIVAGVQLLQVPAVEPVFDVPFKFTYGGKVYFDEVLHFDLSLFDDALVVIRWGELIVFVVGLGFVTRKLIWR